MRPFCSRRQGLAATLIAGAAAAAALIGCQQLATVSPSAAPAADTMPAFRALETQKATFVDAALAPAPAPSADLVTADAPSASFEEKYVEPTAVPTAAQTAVPTAAPTAVPTAAPTAVATAAHAAVAEAPKRNADALIAEAARQSAAAPIQEAPRKSADPAAADAAEPEQQIASAEPAKMLVYESGIASTYGDGDGFEGMRTGCGGIFHTHVVQVAHKTLPCGTVIRIEDTDTGKTVDAEVTDRGPYVSGRIVDLSLAAFTKLDPAGTGLLHVNVYILDTSNQYLYRLR